MDILISTISFYVISTKLLRSYFLFIAEQVLRYCWRGWTKGTKIGNEILLKVQIESDKGKKSGRQWAIEKECVLPKARNVGWQCLAIIYRGGVECGNGKEAELPVLGDTGSHCHTVTVGTTHSVVVVGGRWWLVGWLVGWLVVRAWPTICRR